MKHTNQIKIIKYTKIDSNGKIVSSAIVFKPTPVDDYYTYIKVYSNKNNNNISAELNENIDGLNWNLDNLNNLRSSEWGDRGIYFRSASQKSTGLYENVAELYALNQSDTDEANGTLGLGYRTTDGEYGEWRMSPNCMSGNLIISYDYKSSEYRSIVFDSEGYIVADDFHIPSGATLKNISASVSSLNTSVSNLSTTVSGLSTSVSNLSTSLSALQTNVATYYQPFGSSGASLKSGQNLNEFYSGVILGAGMGNAPNGDWWLVVSGGTGGTTVQRAYNLWNGQCYYRYCASGNWSGWGGTLNCGDITGTGAITISNGNMTSAGVITNALRMPTRAGAQTTAKPNVYFDTAGNLYKTSTTSSKRFKEDVKLVENEDLNPENLYDIDVVQFKYKKGHFTNKEDPRYRKDMIGFIAENVYEHYPMAVDYHIGDDGNVVCDGWNEQYLIPAMLKLIQDQHKRILELEKGIQNG